MPNCSNREGLRATHGEPYAAFVTAEQAPQECGYYSRFSAERRSMLHSSQHKHLAVRDNAQRVPRLGALLNRPNLLNCWEITSRRSVL